MGCIDQGVDLPLRKRLCHNKTVSRRLFLLLLILLAVVLGAALVLRLQISTFFSGSSSDTSSVKEESGEEAPKEFSCTGEVYTNLRQGYQVCYPSGWNTREFGYSQMSVGFDPFPIPEVGEYGGMFTISVSRKSSAALLSDYLKGLEEPATSTVEVGGITGIKVSGTFPSDQIFFADYFQIVTVVETFDRTYTLQLLSAPDDYETNVLRYEEFVGSFRFLEDASPAPWGKSIYLTTPWPNDEVGGTFRVAGSAQGAFESTVVVRLKNAKDAVIFEQSVVYNAPDVGERGYFDVEVNYSTSTASGVLEVFYTSPKDGAVVDLVSVPLRFK
ncbi:MAG: hypothetical protein BMS9Abin34_055 [Patescibacteria group bacterium]|nr:MAG: hypothetical protein BMS9Abin34_055 [Patescibacteria group bacterium]